MSTMEEIKQIMLEEARDEGMRKGIRKGIQKGLTQAQTLAVKNLLKRAIPMKEVALIAGVSMEFVKKVKGSARRKVTRA